MDTTSGKQKTNSLNLTSIFNQYFVAFWTVGITFVITLLISPLVPPDISSLFIVAVMISAWRGGLGAGLLATFLSVLIDIFIFIPLPSKATVALENNADFVQLMVDIFAAVVVGALSASKSKNDNERKELLLREQAARIEAEQANAVKDEFLAAVSHELRTPLTTIKILTRILLLKDPPENERQGYLEDIASECDRQINLVHNLLDLSRIKAGNVKINFEQVDVVEVLYECEKLERIEAHERNHQLTVEIAPDLSFMYAERDALRRVICTIIENAIKYTPDGGSINLSANQDNPGKNICIKISDTGYGIDEADLPHIFESFYRGQIIKNADGEAQEISGVGLGLYLARSLVEAMNGKISVESRIGKGSVFTICLPVWRAQLERKEQRPARKSKKK